MVHVCASMCKLLNIYVHIGILAPLDCLRICVCLCVHMYTAIGI